MLKSTLLAVVLLAAPTAEGSRPPKHKWPPTPSKAEIACLAKNIYHEARGEPRQGQLAVAYVTLNRTQHKLFSNTICAVVFEKGQFSWTRDKTKLKQPVPKHYHELARLAIYQHERAKFNALFFHNTTIKPQWKRKRIAKIGNHIFYA